MSDKKKIHVKIRNTQKIVFEGEVDRISSFNQVGPFDIYPQHANFISIIRDKLSLYNEKEKVKELEFERAVLEIKKDVAKIFTGIEVFTLPEKIQEKPQKKKKK